MVGGVPVEQVRGELDRLAHRAADQLAEATARRAAAGVQAGQLDPRVDGHPQLLQLPGELAVGQGVLADHDVPGLLQAGRHALPAVGLAQPDDPALGLQLDHVAEEVRPVAAARRQQRRVGQRDRRHRQPGDRQAVFRTGQRAGPTRPARSEGQQAGDGRTQQLSPMQVHGVASAILTRRSVPQHRRTAGPGPSPSPFHSPRRVQPPWPIGVSRLAPIRDTRDNRRDRTTREEAAMSTASTTAPTLLTAAEFARRPDPGHPEELVRGRIVPMPPPTRRHGQICSQVRSIFSGNFFEDHDLGHVVSNDAGVITERGPDTVRGADVAFYSYNRVPKGPLPADYGAEAARAHHRGPLAERSLAEGARQGRRIPRCRGAGRGRARRRFPDGPPLLWPIRRPAQPQSRRRARRSPRSCPASPSRSGDSSSDRPGLAQFPSGVLTRNSRHAERDRPERREDGGDAQQHDHAGRRRDRRRRVDRPVGAGSSSHRTASTRM